MPVSVPASSVSKVLAIALKLIVATLLFAGSCGRVPDTSGTAARYSLAFQDAGATCGSGTCGLQAAESAAIRVPAAVTLDPKDVGAARSEDGRQRIAIRLTERGFRPAVVVLRRGVPAELEIRRRLDLTSLTLTVPVFASSLRLDSEVTVLEVTPGFDFTAGLEGRPDQFYVRVLDQVDRRSTREAAGVVERYLELARQ